MRKILREIASPKNEKYNEEERKELLRVLNEEVVSESGGGSSMEYESDPMLGGNSIHFDLGQCLGLMNIISVAALAI